jgi:hypothetical protein
MVGEQVARAGFALLQPVSVLAEAIRNDPGSPIAMAAAIREKTRGAGTPLPIRLLLPVLAAAVMSTVDLRRRPTAACVAYGVTILALYGWTTSRSPAFTPPSAGETAVALAITVVAAFLGAALGRWLGDALAPPPAPRSGVAPRPAPAGPREATSRGR